MSNPAMIAMLGPAYGLDNYTNGAMFSQMMLLFTIIAVAIMNIFLVTKYTRKEEEEGRSEVIRSLPVGRLSNLSAVMLAGLLINTVIALVVGLRTIRYASTVYGSCRIFNVRYSLRSKRNIICWNNCSILSVSFYFKRSTSDIHLHS